MSKDEDAQIGCIVVLIIALVVMGITFAIASDNKSAEIREWKNEALKQSRRADEKATPVVAAEADPQIEILKAQLAEARAQQVWSPLAPLQAELQSLQREIILLHKKIDGVQVPGDSTRCHCKKVSP